MCDGSIACVVRFIKNVPHARGSHTPDRRSFCPSDWPGQVKLKVIAIVRGRPKPSEETAGACRQQPSPAKFSPRRCQAQALACVFCTTRQWYACYTSSQHPSIAPSSLDYSEWIRPSLATTRRNPCIPSATTCNPIKLVPSCWRQPDNEIYTFAFGHSGCT